MRRSIVWLSLVCWLGAALPAPAATGRVIKVLPHLLDLKGRHMLSPSLYERDAYQAQLRQHPEQRSGIRYDVQWKTKDYAWEPLKLRVELRGFGPDSMPRQLVLEEAVKPTGWLGRWTSLTVKGEQYKQLGDVTAWRVTLWEGEQLLSEQKSFLW